MAKRGKQRKDSPTLATNRSARHEYHLLDRFEAGIALLGSEVKSARLGRVNLKEGYVRVEGGEVFLLGVHISPYEQAHRDNHDPVRRRKLLLHAREIRKLAKETVSGGTTIVPLSLYLKGGRIKLEIAVARGKKLHDKRESSRQREVEREIAREKGLR